MLIRLSYPLEKGSPLYPGSPELSINSVKSIAKKDSANTSLLSIGSHSGTHIDAPLHFCDKSYSVKDILKPVTIFSPAICIDIKKNPDSCITKTDFIPLIKIISDAEAILIRTGFFEYRKNELNLYTESHPWIHPNVPGYLRESCPRLKLVGFDTISISNPSHKNYGRAAHRAFLCNDHPLLLLEDADLSDIQLVKNEFELHIYPWIIDKLDGTPVTAIAVSDNSN